jgi:hypothetical protein
MQGKIIFEIILPNVILPYYIVTPQVSEILTDLCKNGSLLTS